jgi:hypothetical protein
MGLEKIYNIINLKKKKKKNKDNETPHPGVHYLGQRYAPLGDSPSPLTLTPLDTPLSF